MHWHTFQGRKGFLSCFTDTNNLSENIGGLFGIQVLIDRVHKYFHTLVQWH